MVEEVKRFFAGARHPRNGVAVTQGEAKLHIDLLGSLSRDPVGAKPVILVGLHHIANLESMDGAVVLIHLCDGIPLNRKYEKGWGRKRGKEEEKAKEQEINKLTCTGSSKYYIE